MLGYLIGGAIAPEVAVRHAGRVGGLILFATLTARSGRNLPPRYTLMWEMGCRRFCRRCSKTWPRCHAFGWHTDSVCTAEVGARRVELTGFPVKLATDVVRSRLNRKRHP
jgi:hypothetical protein